ncbi:MAG: hypothetical protein AABY22_30395 [Nanoarchaeota archaeon]
MVSSLVVLRAIMDFGEVMGFNDINSGKKYTAHKKLFEYKSVPDIGNIIKVLGTLSESKILKVSTFNYVVLIPGTNIVDTGFEQI